MSEQTDNPKLKSESRVELRDYFAARAMQGMIVRVDEPNCPYIANEAYEMADAMMDRRRKK